MGRCGDVWVYEVAEDTHGAVWLATGGAGVYRYAAGEWTKYLPGENGVGLPSSDIQSITLAPDGSLWFGAYYDGAAHFDGSIWQTFDVGEDGLVHSNVTDIFIDEQGAVWFATSGGVTRYRP
jgi:ligand-binding sensor domain-containing protein